jgi:hypothetical protein
MALATVASPTAHLSRAAADPTVIAPSEDEGSSFLVGVQGAPEPADSPALAVTPTDRPTLDFCGRTPEEAASRPWDPRVRQVTSTTYVGLCPLGVGGGLGMLLDAVGFGLPEFAFGAAPPPPPDPAVVAQQAIDTIDFPIPQPQLGPEEALAVNRWIYLSVGNNPGPLTAEAAVPGLAITATATLTSSTWSMGEITAADKRSTVAPITCTGGGTRPSPTANVRASEPKEPGSCAYAYRFRSLPERTGGTGSWPVTVTTNWSITWTATDGSTGTATRSQTSDPFPAGVGEWQSVLVPG